MSEYQYNYSVSNDFPNGVTDISHLQRIIKDNVNITSIIRHITVRDGENMEIYFYSSLSQLELDELNNIISTYVNINSHFNSDNVKDTVESSTTSTDFVNRSTINLNKIPKGDYKISWNYSWGSNNIDIKFCCNILLNDNVIYEYTKKANDTEIGTKIRDASFIDINMPSDGDYVLKLDYKIIGDNIGIIYIYNSFLEILRL